MKKKTIYTIFGVACFVVCIVFFLFNFVMFKSDFRNFVYKYSDEYHLSQALVFAVIRAESNFDEKAVSKSDAKGLMQIIPSTAKWIAETLGEEFEDENLYDPETNIKYGCYYLKYLTDKLNDEDAVICAYNAGETAVRSWLDECGHLDKSKISFAETKNYLEKVKCYKKIYLLKQGG